MKAFLFTLLALATIQFSAAQYVDNVSEGQGTVDSLSQTGLGLGDDERERSTKSEMGTAPAATGRFAFLTAMTLVAIITIVVIHKTRTGFWLVR